MSYPRTPQETWTDRQYIAAIQTVELELMEFRDRYGRASEAEAVFAKRLAELRAARAALPR